jgi:nucleoside-diphosphate-sugar epimerase
MRVLVIGGSGFLGGAIGSAIEAAGGEVLALSRRGTAVAGTPVRGDARAARLGLGAVEADRVRAGLTHIVSCFGSVDWSLGPADALALHREGTCNVLRFAETCPAIERVVHVSSVLALGRPRGTVGNRELDVGQRFRNWYEYAKYASERLVRDWHALPRRVLRFGPVLGASGPLRPAPDDGLLAVVPPLLAGYPVHLERRGAFPIYAGDVGGCAEVAVRALTADSGGLTWTWFDPALPSLAEVLTRLCRTRGAEPRIVDMPLARPLQNRLGPRLGLPRAVVEYARPWVEVDPGVLDAIPGGAPGCPPGYIERSMEPR